MKTLSVLLPLPALVLVALLAGCQSSALTEPTTAAESSAAHSGAAAPLQEGDVVKISFPGARDLDPPEPLQIRRDGRITLPMVGEVGAAGLTPAALQTQLGTLYSTQLQSKEVIVTVVSSNFIVFVDGAVLHAGRVAANHPLTILEAVMEAGGFDYTKADIAKVMVIRKAGSDAGYAYYTLNLRAVLQGKPKPLFYLAPGDMIHVPERFSWF